MIKSKVFLFCKLLLIFAFPTLSVAQEQEAADTAIVYTDLSKALQNPSKVYKLKLKRKKLSSFPVEIFKFENLRHLDLTGNSIVEIPAEIGKLKNLEYLNLSRNQLIKLPSEISDLKELKQLILNNNEIDALPPRIGELVNLEYLDLWSNELGYFPDDMRGLAKSLKTLDLRGILIDDDQQKRIRIMLPTTQVFMSPSCNCGK